MAEFSDLLEKSEFTDVPAGFLCQVKDCLLPDGKTRITKPKK